jgi:ferritin-like metal-binding protein YciE
MKTTSLRDLFEEELQDAYDAENQLIKALPKMAKAAASDELRQGFEEHLEQTRQHVQRLEQIFEQLGEDAKGKKCKGMEGAIKEGSEIIKEKGMEDAVKDAALISAAQRVEHYEIAAYGTLRTWANLLGEEEAVSLLEETLNEEKETDQKLTQLAESVNPEAQEGEEGEEASEEEAEATTPRKGRSGRRRTAA